MLSCFAVSKSRQGLKTEKGHQLTGQENFSPIKCGKTECGSAIKNNLGWYHVYFWVITMKTAVLTGPCCRVFSFLKHIAFQSMQSAISDVQNKVERKKKKYASRL